MAQAFLQALQSELSCPICLELFVEPNIPKDLTGCDHVICTVCLVKMGTEVKDDDKVIICPECRNITIIPKDGVLGLRTNRKLRNLAEKHPKDDTSKGPSHPRSDMKSEVLMCPTHADMIRFYCTQCNKLICQACLEQDHGDHQMEETQERYEIQQNEMQNTLSETKQNIDKCKKTLKELKALKKQIQASQHKEEQKIDKCIEKCMNRVMEQAQDLKTGLHELGQKKQQQLDGEIHRIEKVIVHAERQCTIASDVLSGSIKFEYISRHDQQRERLQKITFPSTVVYSSGKAAAVFEEHAVVDLGTLVTEEKDISICRKEHVKPKFIQTIKLQAYRVVWGLDNQLVLAEGGKKNIKVYQQREEQFILFKRWGTENWSEWNPEGLSVERSGHIYVAMWESIHVYSPDGRYERKLKYMEDDGVSCVNVTNDGRIIVGNCKKNSIIISDPTGVILRKFNTTIAQRYMILAHDTHVIMSDFKSDKVCIMDIESGQETLLHIPRARRICFLEENDTLLVLGNEGRNVELYSYSTGNYKGCLMEGLRNAWDMALSSNGILAVAEENDVTLYEILE